MDKNERIFTAVLIASCILGYASVLIPQFSDFFDWGSFLMGLGLFIVIIASEVGDDGASSRQEVGECTNQN